MPQPELHLLHRNALSHQEASAAVTKIMKTNRPQMMVCLHFITGVDTWILSELQPVLIDEQARERWHSEPPHEKIAFAQKNIIDVFSAAMQRFKISLTF